MANLGYIQVTRICNQKCLFCSNPENQRTISVEDALRQAKELASAGYSGVILTGGEPTLHPEIEKIIQKISSAKIAVRMITNGQKTAESGFLKSLKNSGLVHLHVSVHSVREDVQAYLTQNKDSLANILKTLDYSRKLGINCDINIVICAQNADHLDENVILLTQRFPNIRHFVFNMLDTMFNRVDENPYTVARCADVELSLHRALHHLESTGRSFRVERLPLCYMVDFAFASTETRKIVKNEERTVNFLDEKNKVRQTDFFHDKGRVCAHCFLDDICAGLYDLGGKYKEEELYPVFVSKEPIIRKILKK